MSRSADAQLGGFQLTTLVVLRMLVGWHFLYEGIAKLTSAQWTSAGYLQESQGWFGQAFQNLAANASAVGVVDVMNEWGLIDAARRSPGRPADA